MTSFPTNNPKNPIVPGIKDHTQGEVETPSVKHYGRIIKKTEDLKPRIAESRLQKIGEQTKTNLVSPRPARGTLKDRTTNLSSHRNPAKTNTSTEASSSGRTSSETVSSLSKVQIAENSARSALNLMKTIQTLKTDIIANPGDAKKTKELQNKMKEFEAQKLKTINCLLEIPDQERTDSQKKFISKYAESHSKTLAPQPQIPSKAQSDGKPIPDKKDSSSLPSSTPSASQFPPSKTDKSINTTPPKGPLPPTPSMRPTPSVNSPTSPQAPERPLSPTPLLSRLQIERINVREELKEQKTQLSNQIKQLSEEIAQMKKNPNLGLHFDKKTNNFYTKELAVKSNKKEASELEEAVKEATELFHKAILAGVDFITLKESPRPFGISQLLDRFIDNTKIEHINDRSGKMLIEAKLELNVGLAVDNWGSFPEGLNLIKKNSDLLKKILTSNSDLVMKILKKSENEKNLGPTVFLTNIGNINIDEVYGNLKNDIINKQSICQSIVQDPNFLVTTGISVPLLKAPPDDPKVPSTANVKADLEQMKKGSLGAIEKPLLQYLIGRQGKTIEEVVKPCIKNFIERAGNTAQEKINLFSNLSNEEKEALIKEIHKAIELGKEETKKKPMDFNVINQSMGQIAQVYQKSVNLSLPKP